jgi:DNA-binding XRE family transcriptional regulator
VWKSDRGRRLKNLRAALKVVDFLSLPCKFVSRMEQRSTRLGEMLKRYRQHRDKDMRVVAQEIGISLATYQRLESGGGTPEFATARKLEQWMYEEVEG